MCISIVHCFILFQIFWFTNRTDSLQIKHTTTSVYIPECVYVCVYTYVKGDFHITQQHLISNTGTLQFTYALVHTNLYVNIYWSLQSILILN